ncbi:MAG: hypothetical protein HZB61_06980 [Nitrospirae bacterium]|nr:hypothetical protein [Nitrospirota bacterium]
MKKRCHLLIVAKGYLIAFLLFFVSTGVHAFQYNGLDLKISSTITETYDDNLTFSDVDKKEDFITALTLRMDALYESKRRMLNLGGTVNHRQQSRFKDIKNSSEDLTFSFKNEFSEYDNIFLSYNFSHSFSPDSFEKEFGMVRPRHESFSNNYGFVYTKNLSEHFTVTAKYNYSQNRTIEANESNWWQNTYGLDLNYLYSAYTVISFSYAYSNGSAGIINRATMGLKQNITPRLYFDGSVGLDSTSTENNRSSTQYINVSLTDEINENTNATLSFLENEESLPDSNDIFSNWQTTASIQLLLSEKLNSSFSGFYGKGTLVNLDINNTLLGVNFSLSYEILENFNATLAYNYSHFTTTNNIGGYNKNSISLGMTKAF